MTDAASTPDPAAEGPGRSQDPGGSPDPGGPGLSGGPALPADIPLSDEDLLALLDGFGVAGTHDPEEDQEAVAAAEWDSRQTHEFGADDEDVEGRTVSPVRVAEHLPAGPGLAAILAHDAPAGSSDWDLPGLAAGYRRLAAWAQAGELAAAAEIASRRAASNPKIGTTEDGQPASLPPEAAAEVALELRMSQCGASAWTSLGCQLRWRLPATGAALSAGTIDLLRARIIAEATAVLSDEHAAQVEQRVLSRAAEQTTGQLRAAVRRAVLAVDPEGAERRRKDSERLAKISLYPGEEGTATLTGSCLPDVHAAAAMARVSAMARALKSAGASGGIDLLRAHVFLGLLLGTMPLIPPPAGGPFDEPPAGGPFDEPPTGGPFDEPPAADATDGPITYGGAGGAPDDNRPPGISPGYEPGSSESGWGSGLPDCRGGDDSPPAAWTDIPCPPDESAPRDDECDVPDWRGLPDSAEDAEECDRAAESPPPDWPPLPAHVPSPFIGAPPQAMTPGEAMTLRPPIGLLDIVMGWSAITGQTFEPAHLSRIGPVSSGQALNLLVLAARSPKTEWRVVVTADDGRAIAVERARLSRRHCTRSDETGLTGLVGRVTIAITESGLASAHTAAPRGVSPICDIAAAVLRAADRAAARAQAERHASAGATGCAHTLASNSYRPARRVRDFVAARDITCRFTTCGQPAWRADLDHTVPWHMGGPTCPCNLGGFCRTHHQVKQLPDWRVDQPEPGTFRWTTPAGRSYLVNPDPYPA